jgi:DNA-binding response OmpR family regulator
MMGKTKVLAVDDEKLNLKILEMHLDEAGFDTVLAEDGRIALQKLEEHSDIAVILLDRMMPNMDGMACLRELKANKRLKDIPVIMQTAAAATEQVLQGINAGVYYYLTKPYDERILLGIIRSALDDAKKKRQIKEKVTQHFRILSLMQHSTFRFRTLDEAKMLAYGIGSCFPESKNTTFGLHELLINAVEHGNLGITYAEKTELLLSGRWFTEVERRLADPIFAEKEAELAFQATKDAITVTIKDAGQGFDWEQYLELSPERAADVHGRGISAARSMSFDSLEYIGCGNEVIVKVFLNGAQCAGSA